VSVDLSVESIISTATHVDTSFQLSSPLANKDAACLNVFTGKFLYAKTLTRAIAAITGTTNSLFMRHG
jgi:hypothetical protein